MGLQLIIAGVDRTDFLMVTPSPHFTRKQNERSIVDFSLKPGLLPARYADFIFNDNGIPIFRGVLIPHIVEHEQGKAPISVDCTGYDYAFFEDVCFWTKKYVGEVTALQILTDLVVEKLSVYGISLDPAQDAGDTFIDFMVDGLIVSDVLRQLGDAHFIPRVHLVSPLRRLKLYVPGTTDAPFQVLDNVPSFFTMEWSYTDTVVANDITITFGPSAVGEDVITNTWIADGVSSVYSIKGRNIHASSVFLGYVDLNGIHTPLHLPVDFDPPVGSIVWDYAKDDGTLTWVSGPPAAGTVITIPYYPQYPFEVNATTGVLPKFEERLTDSSTPTYEVAVAVVQSELLKRKSSQRELSIVGPKYCEPGQKLSVQNTDRGIPTPTIFTIAEVNAEYTEFYTIGLARLWVYTARATETTVYQGSYIDQARELFGGGSSGGGTVIVSPPSGGGGGGGAVSEEVFIGPTDPGGALELWYDVDEPAPDSTIPDHSIELVKLVQIPSQTILGRNTAAIGDIEVLTVLPTAVQNQITHLGTVISGVWNATPIGLNYLAGAGAQGTFVRSNGTNWATSTLLLPNVSTTTRIVYSTAPNTYGESPNLTFDGSTLRLVGDQTVSGFIGSPTYGSQTTGWRIDSVGGADFRYLFVDEMHAKSFITDLEMALAGGQIISKSVAMVAVPFNVPGLGAQSILYVRDLPSMANVAAFQDGDTVMLRRFSRTGGALNIAECVGQVFNWVDQADGTQQWTFVRNSGAEGGNMSGGVVSVDSLALDYGISGNGYYEVNAIDGAYGVNSPYAQIVTWTNAPIGPNKTIRSRFGNLRGITGVTNEYGFIAGTYAPSSGSYLRASNTTFELHNITAQWWAGFTPVVAISPGGGSPYISLGNPIYPAAGQGPGIVLAYNAGAGLAQLWCYSNASNYLVFDGNILYWKTPTTTLDTAGNLTATSATLSGSITATSGSIAGDLVVGTGGQIRSGAVGFASGIGWWLDYNAGAPRFRVGHPQADRLAWDNGVLTIRSGKLLIDGSAAGHIGMGAAPYSIATLNIASDTDDANSYGLLVTNHAGTVATLLTYGDGRLFLGGQLYIMPGAWDQTGGGTNPPSIWNGPFGTHELSGWMRVFMYTGGGGGIPPTGPYSRGWVPVWLG